MSQNSIDPPPDYGAEVAELVAQLDMVDEEIRPLLNDATANVVVRQQPAWQEQVQVQILIVQRIFAEWGQLSPPADRVAYHEAMAAYLSVTLHQYEEIFQGLVENDGNKLAHGLELRDEGRRQLVRVQAALGTPEATDSGDAESAYRAAARPVTRGVTETEAALLSLVNAAIQDPASSDSPSWRSEMEEELEMLRSLEGQWEQIAPPQKWRDYHQVHLEYIRLDIEAYQLAYEGIVEANESKLNQADRTFQLLLAKREELLRLLTELGAI